VIYLVLGAIAAGFALIPLPLFPSWIVVAYMVVEHQLSIPLAIVVGALGTTVGRVGLVAISRVAGERMLGRWSRGNLEYLHGRLESAAGDLGVAVLLAASPPPAGVLFIVAGLVRVKLWLVAASVFVGRIIGYTISVGVAAWRRRHSQISCAALSARGRSWWQWPSWWVCCSSSCASTTGH